MNRNKTTELAQCLQHAVERVRIANAEGNPILSAWLPDAEALLETVAAENQDAADSIDFSTITSKGLVARYPVKGSMPTAVVQKLYQIRELEVERLSCAAVVVVGDLQSLDRGARVMVASTLFAKCDKAARHALLHDEHHHVRSCAVISQSELQPGP